MDPVGLMSLSEDPRSGVRRISKRISLFVESNNEGNLKETLLTKLNSNLNQYYPDVGGFLLGYHKVKMMKTSQEELPVTPLSVKAEFFILHIEVGSELRCIVIKRGEDRVTCQLHNKFIFEVFRPEQCWEQVVKGEMILVKVEHVSLMAGKGPDILGSIIYNRQTSGVFIEIVDDLENIRDEDQHDTGLGNEVNITTTSDTTVPDPRPPNVQPTPAKKRKLDASTCVPEPSEIKKSRLSLKSVSSSGDKKKKADGDDVAKVSSSSSNPSFVKNMTSLPELSSQSAKPSEDKSKDNEDQATNDDEEKVTNGDEEKVTNDDEDNVINDDEDKVTKEDEDEGTKDDENDFPTTASQLLSAESSKESNKAEKTVDKSNNRKNNPSALLKNILPKPAEQGSNKSTTAKVSSSPGKTKRRTAPEGFIIQYRETGKNKALKHVQAPNGEIFKTLKAAWEFVDKNPEYLDEYQKFLHPSHEKADSTKITKTKSPKNSKTVKKSSEPAKETLRETVPETPVKDQEKLGTAAADPNKSSKEELMECVFGKEDESEINQPETTEEAINDDSRDSGSSFESDDNSIKSVKTVVRQDSSSSDTSDSEVSSPDHLPNAQPEKHIIYASSSDSESESVDSTVKPTSSKKEVIKEEPKKNEVFESSSEESDSSGEEEEEKLVEKKKVEASKSPSRPSETVNRQDEEDGHEDDVDDSDDDSETILGKEDREKEVNDEKEVKGKRETESSEDCDDESSDNEEVVKRKKILVPARRKSKETESKKKVNEKQKSLEKSKNKKSSSKDYSSPDASMKKSVFEVVSSNKSEQLQMLSSTVAGRSKGRKEVSPPEGISPIMKPKTKSIIKSLSFFETAMESSNKLAAVDDSHSQASTSQSPATDVKPSQKKETSGNKVKKESKKKKDRSKVKKRSEVIGGPGFM